MTDLGTDLATTADGDLDPMFGLSSGPSLVAADVARRLQTEALFYAVEGEYGFDLRQLAAARVGAQTLATRAEVEALRDERVLDATATVDGAQIALAGTTDAGPFRLVVDVGDAATRLQEMP